MKLISHKLPPTGGSALLVTVVLTGLIGFVLVAYLTLVSSQNTTNARSQSWNSAVPVLEAGLEEALAHLNMHGTSNLNCAGWSQSGSTYSITRAVGQDYYLARIVNYVSGASNNAPDIEAFGYTAMPITASVAPSMPPHALLASAIVSAGPVNYLGRGVRLTTRRDSLFAKGLVAKDQIDMNGNNVTTDSFDSMDPSYSTNGLYTSSNRKDNGDVATNSSLTNSLNVGNANIRGRVATGPGGTVAIGNNGVVGDAAWHAGGNNGQIQPGHSTDDMNVDFPEVQPPWNGGALTPGGGYVTNITSMVANNGTTYTVIPYPYGVTESITTNTATSSTYPNGSPGPIVTNWNASGKKVTGYTHPTFSYTSTSYTTNWSTNVTYYNYILDDGNWELSGLNGSVYVKGDARLYVTASLDASSLTIEPGKSLNLYCGAPSAKLTGNNTANSDGTADSFIFWGLPSCVDIDVGGNASFTGAIYAPNADLKLHGGGNDTVDFAGASITKSATLNGHFNFHYDEALSRIGPLRGWIITSWNELSPSVVPTTMPPGYGQYAN